MSLAAKRVLLVGIGGLGSPAAIALARAGVGTIGIADDDEVDRSNLHRQILFGDGDVGAPKTAVAARRLAAWTGDRDVRVEVHAGRLLPANALDLVGGYDVVVEGSDNFATKFLTADACGLARVPVVHGAAVRWHGTALAVGAEGRPCYRCLFEDLPNAYAAGCSEAGVVGPVVGVVGAVQASLALSFLRGEGVGGVLVTFEGRTLSLRRRAIPSRDGCTLCGPTPSITGLDASRYVGRECDTDERRVSS